MSDFTITKEQLRSLTDPKVKEMFPDAFDNILEVGKWYKNTKKYYEQSIAYVVDLYGDNKQFAGYGLDNESDWVYDVAKNAFGSNNWQPATQEEVFEALKRAAIKMGYKKGLYCFFRKDKIIKAIDDEGGFKLSAWDSNALVIGSDCIFIDGEWAEIVNKKLL
jgi:hypothetical protein